MRKVQPVEIRCNQDGFTLIAGESSQPIGSLEWRDVNAVVAYKRDLCAADLICLGFATGSGAIEVHEEMPGWSQLLEQFPSRLLGAPPPLDWWERVAKPPFAPSVTKLFERS